MAVVTDQTELQAALRNQEPLIQISVDFRISAQINIQYPVIINSIGTGTSYTLLKEDSYSGVMFRIINGGQLTLNNIILDGNQANHPQADGNNRSLILVMNGILLLESGAVLTNNNAYLEGGGVYLAGNTNYSNTLIMSGNARISNCYSRLSGGGIMAAFRNIEDSISISENAVIEHNYASNGAGIYVRSYVQGVGSFLRLSDNILVENNYASSTGGGVNFSGFRDGSSVPSSLIVEGNATISANKAVHGAGIYFYGANEEDKFTLAGTAKVLRNIATGNGGGVYVTVPQGKADTVFSGGVINDNQASFGGGLFFQTDVGGTVHVEHCSIQSNIASSSGGGARFNNTSSLYSISVLIENSSFIDNEATAYGGGIQFISGSALFILDILDSDIVGNKAGADGGGMIFGSGGASQIQSSNTRILQNSCDGFGGAFYFSHTMPASSSLSFENMTITNNMAGLEGGGLRFTSGGGSLDTTLLNSLISDNTAQNSSGGGVWNGGTNCTLKVLGTTEITRNNTVLGNGGGIYFNSQNGTLTLEKNVKITYNHAGDGASATSSCGGGICVILGTVFISGMAEIAYNTALRYGGGICATENSAVTMSGGSIHDNQTRQYGGGVYIANSSLTLTGGDIYSNAAATGGAVYNWSNAVLSILENGQIGAGGSNTASVNAPGIYNEGMFYTEGNRDILNGLYIENRNAVARILQIMTPDAAIELDNSNYVIPNPEGTPIVIAQATLEYPILNQLDADAFTKPVREFKGWEIRLNDDNTQVVLAPEVYTITYENLLGALNPNPSIYRVVTHDIILENPSSLIGYRFVGWFDSLEGGTLVTIIPQGSTGNRILYAYWEMVFYTVSYYPNDVVESSARWIPNSQQVQEGDTIYLSSEVPIRDSYNFVGWNTSPDGNGSIYQPGEAIGLVKSNIDLYAQWKPISSEIYILTYYSNDSADPLAQLIPLSMQVSREQFVILFEIIPVRENFRFIGWNTSSDGTGTAYQPKDSFGPMTDDVILFAQWELL